MEHLVHGDANTLLALSHAEGTAQLYLVTEVMLGDEALKLGYDLARALDVAGATDTNDNFHHDVFPFGVKKYFSYETPSARSKNLRSEEVSKRENSSRFVKSFLIIIAHIHKKINSPHQSYSLHVTPYFRFFASLS